MSKRITQLLGLGLVSVVSAEIKVGDSGALAFGLNLSSVYTSNAFLNSSEEDDLIFTALPTVNYRSDEGAISMDAFVGLAVVRYDDFGIYDSENLKSGFTAVLPDEKSGENYTLIMKGGYNETTVARADVLEVIETDTIELSANGTYYMSEYVSVRSGVFYEDRDANTGGFVDVETVRIPFSVYYDYDKALSVGLGYYYRDSDISGRVNPADSQDHVFFVGVEDLISPLVQYKFQGGLQFRDFDDDVNFDDDDGLFTQLILNWKLTDITNVEAEVENDFSTSAANQSSDTFLTSVTLNHQLDARIFSAIGAKYEENSYEQIGGDRSDDERAVFLNMTYKIDQDNFVVRGGVAYTNHSSNLSTANYDAVVVSLQCSLLY